MSKEEINELEEEIRFFCRADISDEQRCFKQCDACFKEVKDNTEQFKDFK